MTCLGPQCEVGLHGGGGGVACPRPPTATVPCLHLRAGTQGRRALTPFPRGQAFPPYFKAGKLGPREDK